MNRKMTWLAGALGALLILAPALVAQTTWVVSGDDDNDNKKKNRASAYTLFGYDDSAFLGVTMEEETEHQEGGARITSVVEDSPADEAGLEEGDIVVRFGKDTIRGPVALTKKIRDLEPGDEIEITVLRDGRKVNVDVELGERSSYSTSWSNVAPRVFGQLQDLELPEVDLQALEGQLEGLSELGKLGKLGKLGDYTFFNNEDWQEKFSELGNGFAYSCEDGDCDYGSLFYTPGRARLGVQLTETTPELREHLGGSEDAGVLVSKVVKNSAAEQAGIRVGDLIVDVDGDEISSTHDLRRALAQREGETFDIEVLRDGRSMSLSVTLEEDEEDRPTGPRAHVRRLPTPAPVVASVAVAPSRLPRVAVAPAPDVAIAPVALAVPAAPAATIAPLAVTVPSPPGAVVAPVPSPFPAPDPEVAPTLAPMPETPAAPRPVGVVPTKDDVI